MFGNVREALDLLNGAEMISFEDSFSVTSFCSKLLKNEGTENEARDLIIRALDSYHKFDVKIAPILNDLIDSAGLYPYADQELLRGSSLLRHEYHKSDFLDGVYLHEEQQKISLELLSKNSVVLSAPTSFGKSLLIEEIIASKIYQNIVIIQPTLALLDETRKKVNKYKETYKIIVSTNQMPAEELGNIFLFTGERVVEYVNFKSIDFFVIDEFYKLSLERDDDRAIVLNHAFYKLLKYTKRFYLLGPIVKSVPDEFKKTFHFMWYHTNFSTVAVDEISLYTGQKRLKKEQKERILFELLQTLSEPTLIYCSSPSKATNLTVSYVKHLENGNGNKQEENDSPIVEWIDENIHSNWILKKSLKKKIAFHHGAIPRHLGSSIVDEFNSGNIHFLFCTSTLIEGVNTTAKNVVLFDKHKGRKPIDYFDYRNISGRSGRMYNYFVGRVFRIEKEPKQLELDIDIPLVTQENAPPELLIQLDDLDLKDTSKERMLEYKIFDEELLSVIKNNTGISIDGQLGILNELSENIEYFHSLMSWRSIPNYDQLKTVLKLGWDYLLKKNENKGSITSANQLAYFALKYSRVKSLRRIISEEVNSDWYLEKFDDENERINVAVYSVLNIARHWFNYKLPKWLNVLSNLQEYAFNKNRMETGNYSYFAGRIEKGFLPQNLYTLFEHEIPISALRKLSKVIKVDMEIDLIPDLLRKLPLKKLGLIEYEIRKIQSIL